MLFSQRLKALPPVAALVQSNLWKRLRHWHIRRTQQRDQSHYTHFLRLPTQFEALAGPVMEHILGRNDRQPSSEPVRIVVVGCSIGAEVYTIASALKVHVPDLAFQIDASDIEASVLVKARAGHYTHAEVYSHDLITEEFINNTFERHDGDFVVRKSIAACVTFKEADIFSPTLTATIPPADIVFAQNFLFHMGPPKARQAFDCIARLLKPQSALFVDGIDLAVKVQATLRHGLDALDYKIEDIHNENLRLKGWPWNYWGLEPLSKRKPDWRRRYGTIFTRRS